MSECQNCSCSNFDKCLRILNLMLDNEASCEQIEFFNAHMEGCIVCFSHYNLEKQMRQLLKTKCKEPKIPKELADEIRSKILL